MTRGPTTQENNSPTPTSPKPIRTEKMSEAEASALRQEILSDAEQALDLAKFTMVATIGFLGYALNTKHPLIAILPVLILVAARSEIINRKGNTLRIACYLKNFGGPTLRYEERLWHLRKLTQKRPLTGWSGHQFGTFALINVAGYACVGTFSLLLYTSTYKDLPGLTQIDMIWIWIIGSGVALAGWYLLTWWQEKHLMLIVKHGSLEEELHRRWLEADLEVGDYVERD